MANKRISELTSITGANLADADLLVVVDVSDTTMASSGTNKKITMSELAKDSALTDNLIAKTTLTTDGDVLTRTSGAPARITRADLADDTAFSSRYASLASDRLSLTPSQFLPILNTPAQGTLGNSSSTLNRVGALLFDDTADESAAASFIWPVGWTTCKAYIWWSPATAGSGDCRWEIRLLSLSDAGNSDANGNAETHNATAPAQYTVKRTGGTTAYSGTAGQWTRLTVRRYGSSGLDTLTGDSGLIGVELVRES